MSNVFKKKILFFEAFVKVKINGNLKFAGGVKIRSLTFFEM